LFFLRSKRSLVDLSFFFGLFLLIEGVASLAWLAPLTNDSFVVDPSNIVSLQNYTMLTGFIITLASLLYMSFGFNSYERHLPRMHTIRAKFP